MKTLLLKLALIGVSLLIILYFAWLTLPVFWDAKFQEAFLPSFVSGFWSTVFAGSILAPLIIAIIERAKNLEAKLVYRNSEAEVIANQSAVSESLRRIQFAVWNKRGRFEETIYWHIFIEEGRFVEAEAPETDSLLKSYDETLIIKRHPFRHVRGRLVTPVYPDTYNDVVFITVKASKDEVVPLYYYLSTAKGLFPKGVKKDSTATYAEVEMFDEMTSKESKDSVDFEPIKVLPITKKNRKRVERFDDDHDIYIIPFPLSNKPQNGWIKIFDKVCEDSQSNLAARIVNNSVELLCRLEEVPVIFPNLKECISLTNRYYRDDINKTQKKNEEKLLDKEKEKKEEQSAIDKALEKLDYS